jgi:redox-sensitive bicupin YhaK (pirin superfamily)
MDEPMTNKVVLEQVKLGFQWVTLDPFLFCVHHDDAYPAGNEQLGPAASLAGRNMGNDFEGKDGWRMYHGDVVPGFPQHPHRGFETVTIVRRGLIDHSDSLGATARFGRGDTQWLTAGKGIVHSEMFPLLDGKNPNPVELFQIWLNLPAANKMVEPHFSMLWADGIPHVKAPGVEVAVVAGNIGDVKALPPPPKSWAAVPDSDVAIFTGKLQPGASWTLPPAKPGTNRMLYFFEGATLQVGDTTLQRGTGALLQPDVAATLVNGNAEGEFLVLQGRPIGEKVVSYGPFVMNSEAEIQQAFRDYQRTQFGGWPFKRDDPVHPKEQGRFAKHADGKTESREG